MTSRISPGRLFRFAERALAGFGLCTLLYLVAFELSAVVSGSMAPTLSGNGGPGSDRILAEKVSLWFRAPRRFEIVAFQTKDGERVMKRVVGLPGETVALMEGEIVIDGKRIERPPSLRWIRYYAYGNVARGNPFSCGEGYYVLGDDSRDSNDSRFEGAVPAGSITARAFLRVWPLSRVGRIR